MGNKIRIKQIDLQGIFSASQQIDLLSASNYASFVTQLDTTMSSDAELSAVSSSISQSIFTINQVLGSGLISGSSQLTSSYDTRYILSGSITQTTWDNISGKPSGLVSQSTDLSLLNTFTQSIDSRVDNLESWSSSLDSTFATDLQVSIVSSSVAATIGVISQNTGLVSTSSFNSFTQNIDSRVDSLENKSGSYATTGSNEFTGSQNISGSVVVDGMVNATSIVGTTFGIGGGYISFDANDMLVGTDAILGYKILTNANTHTFHFDVDGDLTIPGNLIGATNFNTIVNKPTLISGSSQLTSSFDTRYALSGSGGSIPNGTVSGSSQLTSSYDSRYALSSSFSATSASFNSRFNGLVTTGSNTFSGSQVFSGSMTVTSGQIIASTITNDSSSLYLISGSNLYVQNNGIVEITGSIILNGTTYTSLTGSGTISAGTISGSSQLTSSFDTRYTLSGSVQPLPSGLISGSSQLTSSYDTRYALSGSILTSFSSSVDSRLDTQEAFSSSLSVIANSATKILDSTPYLDSTSWSGSYTGNGGTVKVEANFSLYSSTNATLKTFYLYRDGVIVDSGSFYFNSANLHLTVPTLYYVGTNETGTHSYSIGHNGSSDSGDYASIVVTETFNTLNAGLISGSSQLTASYDTRYTLSGSVQPLPNGVISGSSQLTSSYDTRYAPSASYLTSLNGSGVWSGSAQLPSGVISGSSQLTSSYDVRYALSGSGGSATIPTGTVSGSSQLTSSYDGRYTLTSSFNSFTASAQAVTTGSNSFNGTQTITGSLIITTGSFIGSQITANTSSLYLTSGSNIYVQNNGLVEITGSVIATSITGSIASTNGVISGSSQLTASYDGRYTTTSSFNTFTSSAVTSNSIDSIQTITSASYAALTPVSGTLYIIIG